MCDVSFLFSYLCPPKSATLLNLRVQGGCGHGREGESSISNKKLIPAILPHSHREEERNIFSLYPWCSASGSETIGLTHTMKQVPQSAGVLSGLPESVSLFVSLGERWCFAQRPHLQPGVPCPWIVPRFSQGLCAQRGPQILGFLKTLPHMSTCP